MEKEHLEPNLTKEWSEDEYKHNRPDETPNSYEIGLPGWRGMRQEKKGLGFAYRTDGKWSINGRIVTEPEKILEGIENYFKKS